MKHVKIIGLCLVAVFALVAVAASSASAAEPEWGHCVAVKSKGHYEDSNCTKEDFKESKSHKRTYKGKFEWDSGATAACFPQKHGKYKDSACTVEDVKKGKPVGKYEKTGGPKFTGQGGAGVLQVVFYDCEKEGTYKRRPRKDCEGKGYEEASGSNVECTNEKATGESKGLDEVADVTVRFTGCTAFGTPATTAGLAPGEIQTKTLKGRLGYINKATHDVGVLLEPAVANGAFAGFEVAEGVLEVAVGVGNAAEGTFYEGAGTPGNPSGNDGIISPITPVSQMTHTFTQSYRTEETSFPCPENCENGVGSSMKAILNVPSSFEGGQRESLEAYDEGTGLDPEFGRGDSGEWQPSGQEITNVNTVEGEAEIKG